MPSVFKKYVSSFFRHLGLARFADFLHFQVKRLKHLKRNRQFKKQHPGVVLPPDYMMYESFQINFEKYFTGGREDAEDIIAIAAPHCQLATGKILDWGCGPARIIRHMPELLGNQAEYYGTDYNANTIHWCRHTIPGVHFSVNGIHPPLDYPENYFDFIYGISILTHLSEKNQQLWSNELHRIAAPQGVVLLTTHGEAFVEILTAAEIKKYKKESLIIRKNVKEGHRMFGAFHPPSYMYNVFITAGFQIIKHIPGTKVHTSYISQDVWLLKK